MSNLIGIAAGSACLARRASANAANHKLFRHTAIASTSLLAISTAFVANSALAQTCGAPVGNVANCNLMSYPTGIAYTGFDDLTVNVGSFAGQNGPVTLGGGISITASLFPSTLETLNVGSNVTIATSGDSETVEAMTTGPASTSPAALAFIDSGADITSTKGSGIVTSVDNYYRGSGTPTSTAVAYAVSYVHNYGTISAHKYGIQGVSVADALYANDVTATANSTVRNSGSISIGGSGAEALVAQSNAYIQSATDGFAIANSSVYNSGSLSTTGAGATGIEAHSGAQARYAGYASAAANSAIHNSGAVAAHGAGAAGIFGYSGAEASYAVTAKATAESNVYNSGSIIAGGTGSEGIVSESLAVAVSAATVIATADSTIDNSGSVVASGDGIVAVSGAYAGDAPYASATATTTIDNSGAVTTSGAGANALSALSTASASGIDAYATANAAIVNSDPVVTTGNYANGIDVTAEADAETPTLDRYATAHAYATVVNSGAVTGSGYGSQGIDAQSIAWAGFTSEPYYSNALASTLVVNSGAITTSGVGIYPKFPVGIFAESYSLAYGARGGYAHSITEIVNSGAIVTSGEFGGGIYANANAVGEAFDYAGATASSTVVNSGNVTTSGAAAAGGITSIAYARAFFGLRCHRHGKLRSRQFRHDLNERQLLQRRRIRCRRSCRKLWRTFCQRLCRRAPCEQRQHHDGRKAQRRGLRVFRRSHPRCPGRRVLEHGRRKHGLYCDDGRLRSWRRSRVPFLLGASRRRELGARADNRLQFRRHHDGRRLCRRHRGQSDCRCGLSGLCV